MNEEQMLQEIQESATQIEGIGGLIPADKITDLELTDFYYFKGDKIEVEDEGRKSKVKLLFTQDENRFYKKGDDEWVRLGIIKVEETEDAEEIIEHNLIDDIKILEVRIIHLERMLRESLLEMKKYMDLKLSSGDK